MTGNKISQFYMINTQATYLKKYIYNTEQFEKNIKKRELYM